MMNVRCWWLASTAVLAALVVPAQADVITAWTFENNTNHQVNNSPAPSSGVGTATPIGMSIYPTPGIGATSADVTQGNAADTGTNGNSDLSQIWRVWAQGAGNGWSSQAPIGTQGAVFTASTVGYKSINVSFDWYTTNRGEANFQLEYTTNGSTWQNAPINIGSNSGVAVLTNTTSPNTVLGSYLHVTTTTGQQWFSNLTATISDPLAENNPNFAIELVNASTGADNTDAKGDPLNNTTGNWRFDNVSINGTVVSTPEPSALILLGLTGFAYLGKRWGHRYHTSK